MRRSRSPLGLVSRAAACGWSRSARRPSRGSWRRRRVLQGTGLLLLLANVVEATDYLVDARPRHHNHAVAIADQDVAGIDRDAAQADPRADLARAVLVGAVGRQAAAIYRQPELEQALEIAYRARSVTKATIPSRLAIAATWSPISALPW